MRRRALPAGIAIALLLVAWAMATQPFTAPDEPSHYLRAYTLTDGHLLGPRAFYPGPLTPAAANFVAHTTRAVEVPVNLVPPGATCVPAYKSARTCTAVTPTGAYAPPAYVLPAIILAVADDPSTGLYVSRLASAMLCAVLLVLAVELLRDVGVLSLVGFALALSPMVLFVCSIVNSSGLELAAAMCFMVSVLRISRPGTGVGRGVWAVFALSGALTIATFQAGAVFAVVSLVVGALLAGRRRLWDIFGVPAWAASCALLLAFGFWYAWGQVSGSGYETFRTEALGQTFRDGAPWLYSTLHDAVGTFGSMSTPLPTAVVWLWWILVAGSVLAALVVGSARERAVLVFAALIAALAPIFLYAWVYRFSGFGLQGRQVLPLYMLVPLLSGEVLARRVSSRRAATVLAAAVVAAAAVLEAVAWWFNARANAGSPAHPLGLSAPGAFHPPLGWTPWIVMMILGVLTALAATARAVAPAVRQPRAGPAAAR